MPADWSLHPQLDNDTAPVGDLPLCRVLLIRDANYPWLVLVPRRPGAVEIIDLDAAAQAQLMIEIASASRALRDITSCDKLNVAALGNMVPQLHIHVIARRRTDAAWPRPVWGVAPARPYDVNDMRQLIETLRRDIPDLKDPRQEPRQDT
ncbi:MAG: HIT family protein [Xanthobacteraceae bacterium]|nr:HIT family protein [Xanthobacteraceae bacterium]